VTSQMSKPNSIESPRVTGFWQIRLFQLCISSATTRLVVEGVREI
jgi:hypothetical protein